MKQVALYGYRAGLEVGRSVELAQYYGFSVDTALTNKSLSTLLSRDIFKDGDIVVDIGIGAGVNFSDGRGDIKAGIGLRF